MPRRLYMGLFQSNNPKEKPHSGIVGAVSAEVIKWEPATDREARVIAHRYEYEDFVNGSYLIVDKSQMAIFTNNMSAGNSLNANGDGLAQVEVFVGPCKIKLETGDSRFAPFRNISHALTGGESAFHSTVYFLNTTYLNDLRWGTQTPITVMDPVEEVNVHVRAQGLYGVHIEQIDTAVAVIAARNFLQKIVGTRADYTDEELQDFMRSRILEYVPDLLAKKMVEDHVGILSINAKLSEFSQIIFEKLKEHFADFGLTLDNFSFHNINVPDEDLNAINEMKIKRKQNQLEAEGNAMKMDIESAARARMREREGYTYQQEESFKVMEKAAANEGGGSGFMNAGIGLGMGVGMAGAVGRGINDITANAFGGMNMTQGAMGNSGTVKCPSCGKDNPAGAKFCLECGEALGSGAKCPNCGKDIVPGAKFCLNCGAKLVSKCAKCGADLPPDSKFCLNCGEKV